MATATEGGMKASARRAQTPRASTRISRRIAAAAIRAYRRWLSPALPRRCRYEPTCSSYALEAIETFGILRGGVLAAWRLLRCNPWSAGGLDPVSGQRVRKTRAPAPADQ